MIKRIFFSIFCIVLFSSFLYSQDTNWVIRIRDSEGNIKKLLTVEECLSEISNLTVLRGAPEEAINTLLTNDFQFF